MSGETILKIDLLNRRDVLRGLGGLLVGFALPGGRSVEAQRYGAPLPLKPNAYIHIDSDSVVTFVITKAEMGQGTVTSLSQILADELDCDWNCVRTEFAQSIPRVMARCRAFSAARVSVRSGCRCARPARQRGRC